MQYTLITVLLLIIGWWYLDITATITRLVLILYKIHQLLIIKANRKLLCSFVYMSYDNNIFCFLKYFGFSDFKNLMNNLVTGFIHP